MPRIGEEIQIHFTSAEDILCEIQHNSLQRFLAIEGLRQPGQNDFWRSKGFDGRDKMVFADPRASMAGTKMFFVLAGMEGCKTDRISPSNAYDSPQVDSGRGLWRVWLPE